MFTSSFAPESLKELAYFYGFNTLLAQEVQAAMHLGGALLAEKAQDKTYEVFAHPSGKLASGIHAVQESQHEIAIVSDAIYSERRERGYMGLYDSLGRGPYDDIAKPFMAPTLADHEQEVMVMIEQGVARSLERLTRGGGV